MKFIPLFLLVFLTACGTVDLKLTAGPACIERDWFELGRGDGVRGLPNLGWQESSKNCKGFGDDLHRQYINGWYAGVDEFCSPKHGFTFGKNGHSYYDVCPKGREQGFVKAYQKGLKVFLVENSVRMISKEIRQLETRLSTTSLVEEKSQLMLRLRDLEVQKLKNQNEISKIEIEMTSPRVL